MHITNILMTKQIIIYTFNYSIVYRFKKKHDTKKSIYIHLISNTYSYDPINSRKSYSTILFHGCHNREENTKSQLCFML